MCFGKKIAVRHRRRHHRRRRRVVVAIVAIIAGIIASAVAYISCSNHPSNLLGSDAALADSMSSLPSLVESESGNNVQRSSHCKADGMITLSMDHHFKRHARASTVWVEPKMHCPVMVRAVGPNGTAICNLRAVDPMAAYKLHVCSIAALAKFLPAHVHPYKWKYLIDLVWPIVWLWQNTKD